MERIAKALIELKCIEDFMRRRYLYEHPIFAHITKATDLLEAEVAAQTPPPPAELEEMVLADPEVPGVDETDLEEEPEVPPEVPKRRQNRRRGVRT